MGIGQALAGLGGPAGQDRGHGGMAPVGNSLQVELEKPAQEPSVLSGE